MAQSEVKVLRLKVGDFIIAKVSEMKDSYTMDFESKFVIMII